MSFHHTKWTSMVVGLEWLSQHLVLIFRCCWYVIPIKFCLKPSTSKRFSYLLVTAKWNIFKEQTTFWLSRVADITLCLCLFPYCFWFFRQLEEERLNMLHLRLPGFFFSAKRMCVSETSVAFHHCLPLMQSSVPCWIEFVANTLW